MLNAGYGQKIPEAGDKGSVVFKALEDNIQSFVDHTHDGVNSAPIASTAIVKPLINIDAVNWVASDTGYSQTVTLPGAATLDKVGMRFRVRSGALQNHFIHPTIKPTSLTQFVITVNDSSLNLECLFL